MIESRAHMNLGVRPSSGQIVFDATDGKEKFSFPAPGKLLPFHRNIGLLADGGYSLIYVNSDDDPGVKRPHQCIYRGGFIGVISWVRYRRRADNLADNHGKRGCFGNRMEQLEF